MVDVGYKVAGAYEIRNSVTGQKYIGSSIDIRRKCIQHRSELRRGIHDNSSLQEAWSIYGEQAFVFSVLAECDPKDKLNLEQSFLPKERTVEALLLNGFYNQCPVAGSQAGTKRSPEEVERMRERSSNPSIEQRRAVSEANRRRVITDESRQKHRDARIGSKHSPETREKMRISSSGRKHSEESRRKISETKRKQYQLKLTEGNQS